MSPSDSYRYVLPEIHRSRVSRTYLTQTGEYVTVPPEGPVTFPDTCPACGAARTVETRTGFGGAQYACGATYKSKPQIQNRTDKWWGSCPVTKAEVDRENP